ncbi:MAG: hypothetical protein V2I37_11730 [Marinilabiliaceae bacterium]|jgi:hypothetical protein|nr:hypothetical protein [Marinilabiliaceae bacterium]
MKWKLNLDLWESKDYNENIKPVVRQVAAKFDKLVDAEPTLGYKPLWIVNDLYYGMRIYTPYTDEYYKLGLTVGHLTYGKVAYQFSHLMSIIYTDPRQITWFSNSLAHMASFWFLDYFAEKWLDNYPAPEYEGAYEAFSALKTEKIKTAYKNIDIMLNLATNEWLQEEVKQLNSNSAYAPPFIYDHIGLELLPLFRKSSSWKLFPYIGRATSKPIEDQSDMRLRPKAKPDFELLEEIVPEDLKELVQKIRSKLAL